MAAPKKAIQTLLLTIAILLSSQLKAGYEHYYNRKTVPGGLVVGTKVKTDDYQYGTMGAGASSTWGFTNKTANGWIEIGVDFNNLTSVSAFDYCFQIEYSYTYYDYTAGAFLAGGIHTTNVRVAYDPAATNNYQDNVIIKVPNAHRISAKIKTVYSNPTGCSTVYGGALPANLYLETKIDVERYYDFQHWIAPTYVTHTLETNDPYTAEKTEIEVKWDYVPGAEEYQLEYTFICDYKLNTAGTSLLAIPAGSLALTDRDFSLNCTRVTTTNQHYRIPILFERGYVVYRVRGVGRGGPTAGDYSKYKFGIWSSDNGVTKADVADYPHKVYITEAMAHHENKNWQHTATFAEEGKRKDVISYYDGSLRNRQTVTKINSDNNTIAGETIYDFEGRGAVSVLPVPLTTSVLTYYPDLNIRTGVTLPYTRTEFDLDGTSCASDVEAMATSAGASKYYSASNSITHSHKNYIPNASGYPFTVVEYMPDNTGRIRTQSGVGDNHKTGSGHETKYFYGQPQQEELDRLFASDVGNAQHYKKNLVVDANGQASVSYMDMQGRVIATALAGDNPANLLELKDAQDISQYAPANITVDLLNKTNAADVDDNADNNMVSLDGKSLTYNGQKLVVGSGVHKLHYTLSNTKYTDECLPESVCYPLVYDLKVSMKDLCGTEMLTTPRNETINNGYTSTPINCGSSVSLDYDFADGLQATSLTTGQYTISKELKVNEDALNYYAARYINDLDTVNCFKTLYDFIQELTPDIETIPCPMTCEACSTSVANTLGSRSAYATNVDNYPAGTGTVPGSTRTYVQERETYYDQLIADCNAPCQAATLCETRYQMLLADVSPNGQYGSINSSSSDFALSVFNSSGSGKLPYGTGAHWKTPVTDYRNDDGTLSKIVVVESSPGVYSPAFTGSSVLDAAGVRTVEPEQLANLDDFLSNWQSSWAKSLVYYHPEYGYYVECIKLNSNMGGYSYTPEQFEQSLLSVTTIAVCTTANVGTATNINLTNPVNDPFYRMLQLSVSGASDTPEEWAYDYFNFQVNTNYDGTGKTVAQLASITATCGTSYGGTPCAATAIDTDLEWEKYKMLYLSVRQKAMQQYWDDLMIKDRYINIDDYHYYNGCIGQVPFTLGEHPDGYLFDDPYSATTSYFFENVTSSTRPCAYPNFVLYQNKTRRFYMPDLSEQANNADYYVYQQTGLCPNAIHVQTLLNHMAEVNKLKVTGELMSLHEEFTPLLYELITSYDPTNTSFAHQPLKWDGVASGANLDINFSNGNNVCSGNEIRLTLPGSSGLNWSGYPGSWEIEMLSNIQPTSTTAFNLLAYIDDDLNNATPAIQVVLTGSVAGCLNLTNCTFTDCEPNKMAEGTEMLLNALSATGTDLNSTTGVTLNGSGVYDHLFDTYFAHYISPCTSAVWKKMTGNVYRIESISCTPTNYIEFNFGSVALTAGDVFSNINHHSLFSPGSVNRGFDIDKNGTAMSNGITVAVVLGAGSPTYYPGGTCGTPVPIQCQTVAHQTATDLLAMLNAVADGNLEEDNGSTPDKNILTGTPWWSNTLQNQLADAVTDVFVLNGTISTTEFTLPIKHAADYGNSAVPPICTITLSPLTSTSGSITYSSITDFQNLVADYNGPLSNGYPTEFTVQALISGTWKTLRGTSCFELANCNDCIPTPATVVSCNSQYDTYINNSNITTLGYHDDYTEEEFCNYGYAGCLDSYILYLNELALDSELGTAVTLETYCSGIAQNGNCYQQYIDLMYALGYPDATSSIYVSLEQLCSGNIDNNCIESYMTYYANNPQFPMSILDYCADYPVDEPCTPDAPTLPMAELPGTDYDPCDEYLQDYINTAMANAIQQYQQYITALVDQFKQNYIKKCINDAVETLTLEYEDGEYQRTLYYYDQGGNLVRTVPPQGVKVITNSTTLTNIKTDRANNTHTVVTEHKLATNYTYNSLNQLVEQSTPDGGTSKFWYDQLGRIVVSQNAKQQPGNNYSYTTYDNLGRIVQAGQANGTTMTNTIAKNPTSLSSWLSSATKTEVNHTVYDAVDVAGVFDLTTNPFGSGTQTNLRNRVAAVLYQDTYTALSSLNNSTPGTTNYQHATHYSYDIHGNVQTLVQEFPRMGVALSGQQFKKMSYKYDLISGNVHEVQYQQGAADQFYHRYWYDGDNRITNAFTSSNYVHWDQEAKYYYYPHGPLARTEIGNNKVQATDYAYTIQGWIKGINSNTLDVTRDIGQDGNNVSTNINKWVAKDAYSYSLGYFTNDYTSIASTSFIASTYTPETTYLATKAPSLYNGNLAYNVTTITNDLGAVKPMLKAYQYDQLNRLKETNNYTDISGNAWQNGTTSDASYKEVYKYDLNGNIAQQQRNGTGTSMNLEDLTYYYYTTSGGTYNPQVGTPADATNKLAYVLDGVATTATTDDIEDQSTTNYTYDAIGQLISDAQEEIQTITWTVKNRVKKVVRTSASTREDVEFMYDASGNRIAKIAKPDGTSVENGGTDIKTSWTETFYILDANGMVVATYKDQNSETSIRLLDRHIYGTSRLGILEEENTLGTNMSGATAPTTNFTHVTGLHNYEFNSHLGNVLTVITDKRTHTSSGGFITAYQPDIISRSDYSSFGVMLQNRNFTSNVYRYGYNGMEKDDEWKTNGNSYNFTGRIYDPRIGRFLSTDPQADEFADLGPYVSMGNNPTHSVDEDGEFWDTVWDVLCLAYDVGAAIYHGATGDTDAMWEDLGNAGADLVAVAVPGMPAGLQKLATKGDDVVMKTLDKVADYNKTTAKTTTAAKKAVTKTPNTKSAVPNTKQVNTTKPAQSKTTAGSSQAKANTSKDKTVNQNKAGACFIAGTKILTKEGYKNIENIVVGDSVWAFSDSLKIKELKVVYNTVIRHVDTLYRLILNNEEIYTTSEHPFWVKNSWVPARKLLSGDLLLLFNETHVPITKIEIIDTSVTVYNFAVYDFHTYFVSNQSVLVHNNNPCAASTLPPLKGKTVPHIEKTLKKDGFVKNKDNGVNSTWNHSDGSEVRVHKYGNKDPRIYKSANNAHVHKENSQGKQLDDRGNVSTDKSKTHIGIKNPKDLPAVRGRPHGS